jgi:hypothetical protein
MKVVLNSKTKKILAISGGVLVAVIVIAIVVYFATKPKPQSTPLPKPLNPADYQMYGLWINDPGNLPVQYIEYVPEIHQNVYTTITGETLKMASENNTQGRYTQVKSTDVASQVFDASKWNNGYTKADGYYMVTKPSNWEIYGSKLNGSVTVTDVIVDSTVGATANVIYMAISGGYLIMVTQDSSQARTIPALATDTPTSLYNGKIWTSSDFTKEDGNYLLRPR